MTTIDKEMWHQWLDKTGHVFEISDFYYDDPVRLKVVDVALWLEDYPSAMQSFLNQFAPDAGDVELVKRACTRPHEEQALALLRRWIEAQQTL